jgi:hypothetical protein
LPSPETKPVFSVAFCFSILPFIKQQ